MPQAPQQPREGDRKINRNTGQTAVFRQGQWALEKTAGATGEASLRGRLSMGMGPMVQAEQNMTALEGPDPNNRINPLNRDWPAALVDSLPDGGFLSPVAKRLGGQDYQDYTTAAKQFESQLMPIMSGAAVSPSEAKRQIQAVLPQLGDTPETLRAKALGRRQMLNGAGRIMGAQLPYPEVETYGVNTMSTPAPQRSSAQGKGPPQRRLSPEQAAKLPKGTKFIGTDGVERVRQ